MRFIRETALLAFFFMAVSPAAFSRLRNPSEYSEDRINTDGTYFVFLDNGAAECGWASEWTMYSSIDFAGKCAMLVWQTINVKNNLHKMFQASISVFLTEDPLKHSGI